MPIFTKNKEYTVRLTYSCNKNCTYCPILNSIEKDNFVYERDAYNLLMTRIPEFSDVTISGGEPGLIKYPKELELCLQKLLEKQCNLYLETNGLFIKKYPFMLPYFKEVLFHCSSDLDDNDIDIINKIDYRNFRFLLIVHDSNIDKLETYLLRHRNIKFDVIEATYPYEITGPTLSTKNKSYILSKLNRFLTKESIIRLIKGKKEFEECIVYLN